MTRPHFLPLSELRRVAPTDTYDRIEHERRLLRERKARLAARRKRCDSGAMREFFCGPAPQFKGVSTTSIAVNESDIFVEAPNGR